MEVALNNFLVHEQVRWLSLGPTIEKVCGKSRKETRNAKEQNTHKKERIDQSIFMVH